METDISRSGEDSHHTGPLDNDDDNGRQDEGEVDEVLDIDDVEAT